MLVFYGWKKTKKDKGIVGQNNCGNCNNVSDWKVVQVNSWFTLFFIPIILYRKEFYHVCSVCGAGEKLNKVYAKELIAAGVQLSTSANYIEQ